MTGINAVKSEYSGRHVTLDLLLDKYAELQEVANQLKLLFMPEPAYFLPNGTLVSHPSLKAYVEMEKLMIQTVREFARLTDMLDAKIDTMDDVDTFLESIERTNRPHRSVNRGDG